MAAVDFLASRGMAKGQGKKVVPSAIAFQAIEAQPSFGQIKPWRGRVVRMPNSILGKRRGGRRMRCTRGAAFQAKKRNPWHQKGRSHDPAICADGDTPMARVSVGLETYADPSAQTKALAFPVTRTRRIHRTEIQPIDDEGDAGSPVPGRSGQWERCRTFGYPTIDLRRDTQ